MPKYRVPLLIKQRFTHEMVVEADNEEDACAKAESEFSSDVLDPSFDFQDEECEAWDGAYIIEEKAEKTTP